MWSIPSPTCLRGWLRGLELLTPSSPLPTPSPISCLLSFFCLLSVLNSPSPSLVLPCPLFLGSPLPISGSPPLSVPDFPTPPLPLCLPLCLYVPLSASPHPFLNVSVLSVPSVLRASLFGVRALVLTKGRRVLSEMPLHLLSQALPPSVCLSGCTSLSASQPLTSVFFHILGKHSTAY